MTETLVRLVAENVGSSGQTGTQPKTKLMVFADGFDA